MCVFSLFLSLLSLHNKEVLNSGLTISRCCFAAAAAASDKTAAISGKKRKNKTHCHLYEKKENSFV
jgi:hypothetical protein